MGYDKKVYAEANDIIRDRRNKALKNADIAKERFFVKYPQAEMLESLVSDIKVVNFEIQDEIVIRRLSTRRTCKACGANFNVLTLPPKVEGVCDKCNGELYQRDDDKQESIMNRMDVYREQTEPLINFYKEKGKITDLDASIETDILLGKFKEIF